MLIVLNIHMNTRQLLRARAACSSLKMALIELLSSKHDGEDIQVHDVLSREVIAKRLS